MLERWFPTSRSRSLPRDKAPENMLDLLEEMWTSPFRVLEDLSKGFVPSVEVSEQNNEIIVRAEIPGMDPQDIEVSVENNNLVLSGEKKREQKSEQENHVHMECSYGAFNRVIPLRADVDKDKVTAGYKNGVLTVILPKLPDSRSKKIPIESGPKG